MRFLAFFLVTAAANVWLFATPVYAQGRGTIIEDFESGTVDLVGYPDQDQDPSAWELTQDNSFGDSAYALRLYGNTWKIQGIAPAALADTTVWMVAVFAEQLGEMQAFGVSDGANELLYTFAGEQLPQEIKWWTVYQDSYSLADWHVYLLPIGSASIWNPVIRTGACSLRPKNRGASAKKIRTPMMLRINTNSCSE